jgi:putative nucleotidyltransferase with HDIG domain
VNTDHRQQAIQSSRFEEMIDLSNLLRLIFLIAIISVSLISLNMLQGGIEPSDVSTFLLLAITLLLFGVYQKGHYKIAGWGLLFSISVVITYNLAVEGGIHDNGIVIYPVLITFAGLMFGKRIVPVITAVILIEISIIYWLIMKGVVFPFEGKITVNLQHFLTVVILMLVSGVLIWLMINVIENNFQKIIESEEHIRTSYEDTIDGWGRALELFDKETEGHSLRVTALTLEIASTLGIGEEEREHIRRGALLHDIGKMGISDEILNKPGKLTEEERQEIEMHPIYAYNLLKDIPFLDKALEIPYCHHEKWDGTGYPAKLKGEDIPLSARIFAVVDYWDALTSDRPYRKAWSRERTVEYIQDQSGHIFDPQIVEKFLKVVVPDN